MFKITESQFVKALSGDEQNFLRFIYRKFGGVVLHQYNSVIEVDIEHYARVNQAWNARKNKRPSFEVTIEEEPQLTPAHQDVALPKHDFDFSKHFKRPIIEPMPELIPAPQVKKSQKQQTVPKPSPKQGPKVELVVERPQSPPTFAEVVTRHALYKRGLSKDTETKRVMLTGGEFAISPLLHPNNVWVEKKLTQMHNAADCPTDPLALHQMLRYPIYSEDYYKTVDIAPY